eukprot:g17239.t1
MMYLNGGSDDAVQLLQTSTKSSSLLRTITVPKVMREAGQQVWSLSVKLIDPRVDMPLRGMQVRAMSSDSTTLFGMSEANRTGWITFTGVPFGSDLVQLRPPEGYKPAQYFYDKKKSCEDSESCFTQLAVAKANFNFQLEGEAEQTSSGPASLGTFEEGSDLDSEEDGDDVEVAEARRLLKERRSALDHGHGQGWADGEDLRVSCKRRRNSQKRVLFYTAQGIASLGVMIAAIDTCGSTVPTNDTDLKAQVLSTSSAVECSNDAFGLSACEYGDLLNVANMMYANFYVNGLQFLVCMIMIYSLGKFTHLPAEKLQFDKKMHGKDGEVSYTQAGRAAFSGRMDIRVLSGVHCVACGILEADAANVMGTDEFYLLDDDSRGTDAWVCNEQLDGCFHTTA